MKTLLRIAAALAVLIPIVAPAQTPQRFQFTMDLTTVATCQAYRFDLEVDNKVWPFPLVATCTTAGTGSTVEAPIPPLAAGNRIVRVRAVDITSAPIVVGPWSNLLVFAPKVAPPVKVAAPVKPTNLAII